MNSSTDTIRLRQTHNEHKGLMIYVVAPRTESAAKFMQIKIKD